MTYHKREKKFNQKILLPDNWYDREMCYLVCDYSRLVPVNRITKIESIESSFSKGGNGNEVHYYNKDLGNEEVMTRYSPFSRFVSDKYPGLTDLRCKNHHIFYMLFFAPLELERVPVGGNDQIWGEVGNVDYSLLSTFF